ncbi:MAG: glycosyltransferase family 9 protein [Verrucomicrobia bacterium]|nr:glycosyltransferase family 9 protein [Verrucomicrobiota bacterium]
MRLLFVKLKHIGDSLLLTPTLAAVREAYPDAAIWVAVREGCEGILAGCPAIDRVLTTAAPEHERRPKLSWWSDLGLVRTLRRERFDFVFELSDGDRGRWLAWASGAKHRCTNTAFQPLPWWWRFAFDAESKFDWPSRHRVEKDFYTVHDFLPLPGKIPPLVFEKHLAAPWGETRLRSRYVVLHPGTRWRRKRWPEEKWIEFGRSLLSYSEQLVISVGPAPEEIRLAANLAAAVGPAAISTEGKLSWRQLAGLLFGAQLFVGVDTAAMHLAAACQCPVVALFRPAEVSQWRPWCVPHRVVVAKPPEKQAAPERLREQTAENIDPTDVLEACREMLASGAAHGP